MRLSHRYCPALVLAILIGTTVKVGAEPAGPATLWSFLGIPQGLNKVRDVTTNRHGNFPGLERKPALKALADPANLESGNLAIKTAAEIKKEEDLAPQKIKALKYLATIGCGCHPNVAPALLAGLKDCTEEVRYEAAIAICEAAGSVCNKCEGTCCSADIMTKLQEMGYERGDNCCYSEASARVRAVARSALKKCRRKVPMDPGPGPGPEGGSSPEGPTAAPVPIPDDGTAMPMAPIRGSAARTMPLTPPMPAPTPAWIQTRKPATSSPTKNVLSQAVNPVSWEQARRPSKVRFVVH